MASIKDSIIQYIQHEDTKKEFFSMIEPVYKNIYNEIYPYIWFVSIYMVILTFIILVNLVLLIRVLNNLGSFYISTYEST